MDEGRCRECGAALATHDARFCHKCGAVIAQPEAPPAQEAPVEPPPPSSPRGPAGSGSPKRLLGPLAAAIAGATLVVLGIVASGGGDDAGGHLPGALRSSGLLNTAFVEEADDVPSTGSTVADFTADQSNTPATTITAPAIGEEQVALFEPFDGNERGWVTGVSGDVTRSLVDGVYRVSVTTDSAVLAYTWRPGIQSSEDFQLGITVSRRTPGIAACGLGLAAEADYPRLAFLVDDETGRFRIAARSSSDAATEDLIGWTESEQIDPGGENRVLLLSRDGEVWAFINDLAVAKLETLSFDPSRFAVVVRGPGGDEASVCDFDDLELRRP